MSRVQSWLAGFSAQSYWVWATDITASDKIQWMHYERDVSQSFWMEGEPDHAKGEYAYLDKTYGLGLAELEADMASLCQVNYLNQP